MFGHSQCCNFMLIVVHVPVCWRRVGKLSIRATGGMSRNISKRLSNQVRKYEKIWHAVLFVRVLCHAAVPQLCQITRPVCHSWRPYPDPMLEICQPQQNRVKTELNLSYFIKSNTSPSLICLQIMKPDLQKRPKRCCLEDLPFATVVLNGIIDKRWRMNVFLSHSFYKSWLLVKKVIHWAQCDLYTSLCIRASAKCQK